MKFSNLAIVSLVIIGLSLCESNKYADVDNLERDKPFRMGKINTVWEKARKVLKDKKLTDLYADLVVQDRQFIDLKFKKHHSDDVDGLHEAEVRRNFVGILEKYNLGEHFPAEKQLNNIRDDVERVKKPDIEDEKLKKLWKKASIEGFTESEMEILREELSHHQTKLYEYNSLKTDYELLKENVDNSLDNLDEQDDYWKLMEKSKREMKEKHREIKEHYGSVKKRMEDAEKEEGEFKDPRVYHLWALAQKSGMSEVELNSIKKELTHFDHRIKKTEHVQAQLNKSEQKLESDDSGMAQKVHNDLKDKVKHYNAKVDKYHEDLKYRIQKRLDEL